MSGAGSAAREPISSDGPIAPEDLDTLLAPLRGYASLILAVSGGADSMALMHLCAAWAARVESPPRLLVATVDHGLRAGSAREAEWVGRQAAALNLVHEILAWEGPKPATGVQEAAREARYRLLAACAAREPRPCAVVTAHHQDDQAETLLMRLARGSGIDGLSGMRRVECGFAVESAAAIDLVRPFIDVPRTRLMATLTHLGVAWIEDPSNESEAFERVRLRKAEAALSDLGLTNAQIARSACRLRRAQQALEQEAAVLWRSAVDIHDGAYATIDRRVYDAAPEELRLRVLSRAVDAMGGQREPVRLTKLERLLERLEKGATDPETLGGAIVARDAAEISVFREPGRAGLPELVLAPGEGAIWDGRFHVQAPDQSTGSVLVRALGPAAYATLGEQQDGFAMPRRAAITLPSFWREESLVAVPHLGIRKGGGEACTARFLWND